MSADPLRVLLDVNIFVRLIRSETDGRRGTLVQRIFDAVTSGEIAGRKAQLVVSVAMLDTFSRVLIRMRVSSTTATSFTDAILRLAKTGPEHLDPLLVLGGAPDLSLKDAEDGGVLATVFAARSHLIVTDNLDDFKPRGCEIFATRTVASATGERRALTCQILKSPNNHEIVVAHPVDLIGWMDDRHGIDPASIRGIFKK